MEFKTQKEIDNYIKDNGFFLSDGTLHLKTGDYSWTNIDHKKDKIIEYIKNNTNPLSDLKITFPVISLNLFGNYENREESIMENTLLFDEIKQSQKKFLNNKDWRLIELKNNYKIENTPIKYLIYDIAAKDYNPIKKEFLNDKDLKAAYEVKNIMVINKLNNDNLINQFNEPYQKELERFNKIGVYNQ